MHSTHNLCTLDLLHAEIVWISTEWAGMKITLFGDDETYKDFGKDFCLITLSHRGDLDWVAGYIMGARYGFLHVSNERRVKINILSFVILRTMLLSLHSMA